MAHPISATQRVSRSPRTDRPILEELVNGSWQIKRGLTEASYDAYRRRPPYTGRTPEVKMPAMTG